MNFRFYAAIVSISYRGILDPSLPVAIFNFIEIYPGLNLYNILYGSKLIRKVISQALIILSINLVHWRWTDGSEKVEPSAALWSAGVCFCALLFLVFCFINLAVYIRARGVDMCLAGVCTQDQLFPAASSTEQVCTWA